MTIDEHRLVRNLGIALLVKLVALAMLWWCFVRDHDGNVDAERAAVRMVSPAPDLVSPEPSTLKSSKPDSSTTFKGAQK